MDQQINWTPVLGRRRIRPQRQITLDEGGSSVKGNLASGTSAVLASPANHVRWLGSATSYRKLILADRLGLRNANEPLMTGRAQVDLLLHVSLKCSRSPNAVATRRELRVVEYLVLTSSVMAQRLLATFPLSGSKNPCERENKDANPGFQ